MRKIIGQTKTVRDVLANNRFAIDYYQREYAWQEKQIRELIEDLTTHFLNDYTPGDSREATEQYSHYFLGSFIISEKDGQKYIVDGQQRLTSLTLLLMHLRYLQQGRGEAVSPVDDLIHSNYRGRYTFNLDVPERTKCMESLLQHQTYDGSDESESVRNIVARYDDLVALFPEELSTDLVPYFADWLQWNVQLVEITAFTDDDAYTIFETMNDRGLNLTNTDMLKGFLLANITDAAARDRAGTLWKNRVAQLRESGKEVDADGIKAWLRSQFAEKIRERHKNARPEDFDLIGTEFHRWVRANRKRDDVALTSSPAFSRFIERDFDFYTRQYLRILDASTRLRRGLEHIYYNARMFFTSQHLPLLAPLTHEDSDMVVDRKLRLVATYLDILINRRIWNSHNIGSSTMQYTLFQLTRAIRHLSAEALADTLYSRLATDGAETFTTNPRFALRHQNQEYVRLILARLTDFVERQAGLPSRYVEYVTAEGKQRYEIEHIWANKPERHSDEFGQPADFADYRNRIGGLLLVPKSFNASYGALPYEEKVKHYDAQNLLARSLNAQAYEHNPGFVRFMEQSGLPFTSYEQFCKVNLDERQELYTQIAERVWDPAQLLVLADARA